MVIYKCNRKGGKPQKEVIMLDMTNKEVKLNDVVAYVFSDKHGKISTKTGKVIGFNNKGVRVLTEQGVINVKNVIKLEHKKGIFNNLFSMLKH